MVENLKSLSMSGVGKTASRTSECSVDLVTKSKMVTRHIHSCHDESTRGDDGKHCFIEPPLEEWVAAHQTTKLCNTTPYFFVFYKIHTVTLYDYILISAMPNHIIGAVGGVVITYHSKENLTPCSALWHSAILVKQEFATYHTTPYSMPYYILLYNTVLCT